MARGWESKSVEDQQSQNGDGSPASNAVIPAEEAARTRQRHLLELERERILDERTSNPIRRAALEAALGEIESRLAKL